MTDSEYINALDRLGGELPMLQIEAVFECPPIPHGDHWVAWSDTLGADASPYGRGDTMQEAIDDLMDQLEEME